MSTEIRTLSYWTDWYFETRETTPHYRRSTKFRVSQLEAFAGKPLELTDLNDSLINRWIMHLQETTTLAPKTVRDYRESVLQVWRAAADEGEVETRPERIRKIRVPRRSPIAFTMDEMHALVAATEQLPGYITHTEIPRAVWFLGAVYVWWDAGLRLGDSLNFRRRDVSPCGILYGSQSKTGEPIPNELSAKCLEILNTIATIAGLGPDDYALPYPGSRTQFEYWLRKLVQLAGVRRLQTRGVRRSAASHVEKEHPGMAGRFLGHLTPGLAAKHYLDPSITNTRPVRPPEL